MFSLPLLQSIVLLYAELMICLCFEKILPYQHVAILWWMFLGWYWVPTKWLIFTLPALIIKIFKPKKYKIKTTNTKTAVCNNCGNSWECD